MGVHTALTSLNHPVVQPCEAAICDTCEGGEGGGGCVRRGKKSKGDSYGYEEGVGDREQGVVSNEW